MAMQGTKSPKTGAVKGAVSAILGFAGLAGMKQIASGLVCVFGISWKVALETLPSILLIASYMLQPGGFGHVRLLEDLLQMPVWWHLILTVPRT